MLEAPAWYVGAPGSGKTTAALGHALGAARARGCGLLILDAIGAANFAALPESRPEDLPRILWGEADGRPIARAAPRDARELGRFLAVILAGGRVELLVDEAAVWFGMGGQRPLLALLRGYRHAGIGVRLTTQHLSGDVPQVALALAPTLRVFRSTAPRTLDLLEKEWALNRARIVALGRGEWVEAGSALDAAALRGPARSTKTAGRKPAQTPTGRRKKR